MCLSHHSGLIDVFDITGEDKFATRMAKDFTGYSLSRNKQKVDQSILDRIVVLVASEIEERSTQEISRSDPWILREPIRSFSKGLLAQLLVQRSSGCRPAKHCQFRKSARCSIEVPRKLPRLGKLIDCFERTHFEVKNQVDVKRCEISSSCKQRASDKQGLYYLTVPTGGGKTFASLRFALHHAKQHKLDRIIYVIPYTSIIDQNASKMAKIFDVISKDIVLEHHSNLVPEKDTWRNRILSENWDAPIVFTTSVQLLETLFGGGTRSVRRMHQLAKSVIIFDEIQTLPIKTVHLFNNAINFLTHLCFLDCSFLYSDSTAFTCR